MRPGRSRGVTESRTRHPCAIIDYNQCQQQAVCFEEALHGDPAGILRTPMRTRAQLISGTNMRAKLLGIAIPDCLIGKGRSFANASGVVGPAYSDQSIILLINIYLQSQQAVKQNLSSSLQMKEVVCR